MLADEIARVRKSKCSRNMQLLNHQKRAQNSHFLPLNKILARFLKKACGNEFFFCSLRKNLVLKRNFIPRFPFMPLNQLSVRQISQRRTRKFSHNPNTPKSERKFQSVVIRSLYPKDVNYCF